MDSWLQYSPETLDSTLETISIVLMTKLVFQCGSLQLVWYIVPPEETHSRIFKKPENFNKNLDFSPKVGWY